MVTEIIQERRSRSKFNLISKGVRLDSEPSRLPRKKILNLFSKSKAIKRYVRSRIVLSLPHSLALKTILSFDYRNYLKTRLYRSKPVPSLVHKVQGCILLLIVFMFSKQDLKSIKRREVSAVFHDKFIYVVQCCPIKCKKRNHKYFVSRAKLPTSGEIELNPGPVTQGNNPNHLD